MRSARDAGIGMVVTAITGVVITGAATVGMATAGTVVAGMDTGIGVLAIAGMYGATVIGFASAAERQMKRSSEVGTGSREENASD